MDDEKLPANVSTRKLKKPKGWSYPLQTTEICEGLKVEDLSRKFNIFYDNSPDRPYKAGANQKRLIFEGFSVLSLTYYGHLTKHPTSDDPYFHMGVRLCKPEYRTKLNKILREEVFPLIRKWMETTERVHFISSLSLRYRKSSYSGCTLSLTENKKEIWVKKIDLDEKPE